MKVTMLSSMETKESIIYFMLIINILEASLTLY